VPIAAIPQGVELRKISAVQKKALDDLLNKQKETSLLQTGISVLIPSLAVVGVGAATLVVAWSWLKDKELPSIKETAESIGGGLVDGGLDIVNKVADEIGFKAEPKTQEYIQAGTRTIGPLSRCKRWETDAADVLAIIQAGNLGVAETIAAAVAIKSIAKQMKKEGCDRPTAISQAQWDES